MKVVPETRNPHLGVFIAKRHAGKSFKFRRNSSSWKREIKQFLWLIAVSGWLIYNVSSRCDLVFVPSHTVTKFCCSIILNFIATNRYCRDSSENTEQKAVAVKVTRHIVFESYASAVRPLRWFSTCSFQTNPQRFTRNLFACLYWKLPIPNPFVNYKVQSYLLLFSFHVSYRLLLFKKLLVLKNASEYKCYKGLQICH